MPQFPQSFAQSRCFVITGFCFNTHVANLSLWFKGMTREPKVKLVACQGKEGQAISYTLLLSSSEV